VAKAAPWPVFGLLDEASLNWVSVDVAQLLHVLFVGEYVEVVVPGLPELGSFVFQYFGGLAFEDADGSGERLKLRLGEQQMDMLGHEDVTEEKELVTLPEFLQGFFEDNAGVIVVQVWETTETTEGDEVVVAFGLVTLETARH
jgi:hypothetical protein